MSAIPFIVAQSKGGAVLEARKNLAALFLVLLATVGSRGDTPRPQQDADTRGKVLPVKATRAYAEALGSSSFIFVKHGQDSARRLTGRTGGWETDPVLSPDGNAVAYTVADGPDSKSEVWLSRSDGSHAHRVSAPDEDALLPAFGADDRLLLYVRSRFNGHYSPIARPRKHDFDIVKIVTDPDGPVAGAVPVELTQQHFFDLRSLSVSPDGEHFLVSTSGYPIGSLIEEFDLASPLGVKKIFQPHVPSGPREGPEFGTAAYTPDGMEIVFTAATEGQGGMYDYNIYQMSEVTGADLTQLTHRSGMIDTLTVAREGIILFSSSKMRYSLDPNTKAILPE
jgi:hypothetical protein